MQTPGTPIGANMAACRAAAAGGFVANAEPLGVLSVGAPGGAGATYVVTLAVSNQIDANNCVPHVTPGTVARAASVIQTADNTFQVDTSDLAVPGVLTSIFSFSAIRTSVGT